MGNRIPPITKNLLIINGLFFLAKFVLISKGISLDVILGAFYPESPNFRPWQIVTHMFMHADFMHIFFNMFGLWMFGSTVEMTIGPKKFLTLYLLAGFAGFGLLNLVTFFEVQSLKEAVTSAGLSLNEIQHMAQRGIDGELITKEIYNNSDARQLIIEYITPMVGASGALYGILVAFAVLYPDAKLMMIFLPIPIKAKYFIPILIALELYAGISNTSFGGINIAHFAHLGGALLGFLFIRDWKKKQFRQ
ncbi:rhomboid family intramembrane serine protease [Vaginella massiliensis]|uniref:rhomboid family intramembrane serine protease n=1 Tax=Vaginella massiliensis TaxID=1816680 RepID=UPI000838A432|nr:rhomboid family intramembrane serine protease [Vaginella massiliensis]